MNEQTLQQVFKDLAYRDARRPNTNSKYVFEKSCDISLIQMLKNQPSHSTSLCQCSNEPDSTINFVTEFFEPGFTKELLLDDQSQIFISGYTLNWHKLYLQVFEQNLLGTPCLNEDVCITQEQCTSIEPCIQKIHLHGQPSFSRRYRYILQRLCEHKYQRRQKIQTRMCLKNIFHLGVLSFWSKLPEQCRHKLSIRNFLLWTMTLCDVIRTQYS